MFTSEKWDLVVEEGKRDTKGNFHFLSAFICEFLQESCMLLHFNEDRLNWQWLFFSKYVFVQKKQLPVLGACRAWGR